MIRKIKKLWHIAFCTGALIIGGAGVVSGQTHTGSCNWAEGDLICAKPIVQISLEPVLGFANFIPNSQFYSNRVKNPPSAVDFENDSDTTTVKGFISIPYKVVLNFELRLLGDSTLFSTLDSVSLLLNLELETDTPRNYLVPLPTIQNPSFETFSRIVSNTNLGGTENDSIFRFGQGEMLKKDTSSMEFVILKPKSFPGFFQRREFALPKYLYGKQTCSFKVIGKKKSIAHGNSIYIKDKDGILVMLDEVIDPENTITFSITEIKFWDSERNPVKLTMDTSFNKMKVKFASDLSKKFEILTQNKKPQFRMVYRNFPSLYLSDTSRKGLYKEYLAFRTVNQPLQDSLRLKSDSLYPLYECSKLSMTGDLFSVLILDTSGADSIFQDFESISFFGYASKVPQDGFVPLFHGMPHDTTRVGVILIDDVYSLCLHHISDNPNYFVNDILCYVIPPKDGRTPCPPD